MDLLTCGVKLYDEDESVWKVTAEASLWGEQDEDVKASHCFSLKGLFNPPCWPPLLQHIALHFTVNRLFLFFFSPLLVNPVSSRCCYWCLSSFETCICLFFPTIVGTVDKTLCFSVAPFSARCSRNHSVLEAWLHSKHIWLLCLMECDKNQNIFSPALSPEGFFFLSGALVMCVWRKGLSLKSLSALWRNVQTVLQSAGAQTFQLVADSLFSYLSVVCSVCKLL